MDDHWADPFAVGPCADCGKTMQTLWCLAWDAYVCMGCRSKRTDKELSTTPEVAIWPGYAAPLDEREALTGGRSLR